MAIEQTGKTDLKGLIHHSDRGSQYCCNAYVGLLQKYNISISMTEDYNPTDNAIAERVNGIIKQEVVYREKCFKNRQQAYERLDTFITFYNDRRPHMSLGYQTPSQAHLQVSEQQRVWKKKEDKSCSNEENVVPLQCQKPVSAMDYATV